MGGRQVKPRLTRGKVSTLVPWGALASAEVWVTYPGGFGPALRPTAEERGRNTREGVCEEQSGGEPQGKDEDTPGTEITGVA